MTVINTNINGLIGLNNLRLTNNGLSTSLARLSSGLRINYAADDPSGLAIGKGMEAQIGGIRMATQNAEDGISLIHAADGALSETQDILMRMRDLAVRGSNEAVLTDADSARLASEFQSLSDELTRKAGAFSFNTKGLLDGTFTNGLSLQIGPDNGATFVIHLSIPCMSAGTLAVDDDGLTTVAGAQTAISAVDAALSTVSNTRANLGVQERRLMHVIDDLAAQEINISAAKSRIMDADMAVEISEFTRLQILQQSGTAILAQANAQPQSILQLMQ